MGARWIFALLILALEGILAQAADPDQGMLLALEDLATEVSVSSVSTGRLADAIVLASSQVGESTLVLEAVMQRLDDVLNRTLSGADLIRRSAKGDVYDIMDRGFSGIEKTANNVLDNRRFGKFVRESIVFLFFLVSAVVFVPIVVCFSRLLEQSMKHRQCVACPCAIHAQHPVQ